MNINLKIRLIAVSMAAAVTFGLADGIATMFAAQATQLAAAHRIVVASVR